MTDQRRTDLKRLQKLDLDIGKAKKRILGFEPRIEEVEEPALTLESELGTTRSRVQEMKLEERRLELSAEEKRVRRQKLDERLGSVRNLREEAAVSAELEMVKRSIQNDEQEALGLLDQLRKAEERAAELEAAYAEASALVEPQKEALLAERAEAQAELESLGAERARFAKDLDPAELKIYDAIRAGGRSIAVSDLTEDGACGHCFGMVPLQLQNEIRHGRSLIRCEGCGVILSAPEPVVEGAASGSEDAPDPELAASADETPEDDGGSDLDGGEGEGSAVGAEADQRAE